MNYYTFEAECAHLWLIGTAFSEVSAAAFVGATRRMKATPAPRPNRRWTVPKSSEGESR